MFNEKNALVFLLNIEYRGFVFFAKKSPSAKKQKDKRNNPSKLY